jgi:nucleoside 2-deoxyribosyltransferase
MGEPMKLKVYVAAPWDFKDKAKRTAKKFEKAGLEIAHDWWNYDNPTQDEEFSKKCAADDLHAVLNCDVLYLLNLQERGKETSGKAVELGIALGHNHLCPHKIRIFAEGIRFTNVFQHLDQVEWVKNSSEAIKELTHG